LKLRSVCATLGLWPLRVVGVRSSDGCVYPTLGTVVALLVASLLTIGVVNLLNALGVLQPIFGLS